MTSVLITGCAGFIGSALVNQWLAETDWQLIGVDKLGYAGLRESLVPALDHPRFALNVADICDGPALHALFSAVRPDAVVHLAAESHVDRSIDAPAAFIQTNLVGTAMLLEAARALGVPFTGQSGRVPLPACLDRRGIRCSGAERPL